MRKMKDSGIEWIGQIPSDWDVKRLKYIVNTLYKGNGITKDEVFLEGNIECVRYGEIYSKYSNSFSECISLTKEEIISSPQYFFYGDILFAGTGELVEEIGKNIVYLGKNKCLAGGDIIIAKHSQNPSFLNYALNSSYCQYQKSKGKAKLKVVHITASQIGNILVFLPPIDEQKKIADFLDEKCGEIDSIRSDIQKQIDILNDYKKSVITEAVTKGLNPKAKLKDSGIEWIGKIPEGWDCRPIKYGFKLISGSTPKSDNMDFWDGDVIWITPADYKTEDKYVCQGKRNISYQGFLSCSTNIVPKGSLIFSKRAPIGTVAINSVPLCTNQGCLSCVPKACSSSLYFYFVFIVYEEVFNLLGSGTTFKEISATTFSNVKLPYPSINEQKKIAAYLDEKCSEIDATIADKQKQLETLDEYKKSIIFEYVTGKKEVPT